MKAGRELDALVAEKVMGWTRKELPTNKVNPSFTAWYWVSNDDAVKVPTNFFNPSINLNDAWKVLGKFDGHILTKSKSDGCICEILLHDGKGYDIIGESRAETAELAICLAALKAVGVDVDE